MFFYLLYQCGYLGCLLLPRGVCYGLARQAADIYYWFSLKDRDAVFKNLERVLGEGHVSKSDVREVFRNFALYLVDFFRFGQLTSEKVKRLVRLEGLENMKAVLAKGRGAIGLSAHLGNYELAGAVLALEGFSLYAVVLNHRNPYVDSFFVRQRNRVGVRGIPVGEKNRRTFFEKCFAALREDGIVAIVGDRDFTDHGIDLPLFGRSLRMPTGPAALSLRSGAQIVPAFLIREADGSYRFIFDSPIKIPEGIPRQEAVHHITKECLGVMARYIRRYPTQWYMFQEFWKPAPAFIR